MSINLLSYSITALLIVSILLGHLEYETWSAIGGVTVWCKFFASFGLSRQAHLKLGRNMDKKGRPAVQVKVD